MDAFIGVTGTVVTIRARPVILLRGRVDPVASTASIADAAEICTRDLTAVVPDQAISFRILSDPPRGGSARGGRARQQSNVRMRSPRA